MCSVGDDNIEQDSAEKYLPTPSKFNLADNKCNKCRTNKPQVVLRHKDAYCKDCFLAATVHKFKALLGKHRLIYPNDKVLIEHRGGHASTALLHFLRSGLDLGTHKRLRFEPVFMHIEDNYSLNVGERKEFLQSIRSEINGQSFDAHFTSLVEYLLEPEKLGNNLCSDEKLVDVKDDDFERVKEVLNGKVSKTNKEEVLNLGRRSLLIDAAKILGCKCVFTTELAIDIATQMLTDVSLGRGAHLPLNIGIVDDRDPEVKIIRPLRLFEIKELIFYNIFNNLEPVSLNRKVENPYSSVQNLMRNFVSNLQTNFPATVNTIVRTGDKLAMDHDLKENPVCKLCKAPIESIQDDLTSAESTRFSHWVSTQKPDYTVPPVERYERTLDLFSKSVESDYCFACKILRHSLKETDK